MKPKMPCFGSQITVSGDQDNQTQTDPRMFSKPTVFILGAGASAELGLPVGDQLKREIASSLTFGFDFNRQVSGDPILYEALQQKYGAQHGQHSKAGREFSKIVSSFVSIDEALHYYSGHPEVVLLGKLAIARQILKAERGSKLHTTGPSDKANLADTHGTWLSHFLSMASSSLTLQQMDRAFAQVTMINFNYDRSIEYYLFGALQEQLNLSVDAARAAVEGLTIIRPYGSVGAPSWQPDGVPYGGDHYERNIDLFKTAEGIRTHTEQNIDGAAVSAIRKHIEAAHLVVILGFGFHEQNVALLSIDKAKGRRIFATVSGIAEPNYPVLADRITRCAKTTIPPELLDMRAAELLGKLRPSIMLAAN